MKSFGAKCVFFSIIWFSGLAGQYASAQSIYGSIRGLVSDPSGAIVANGKVVLINEATAEQHVHGGSRGAGL